MASSDIIRDLQARIDEMMLGTAASPYSDAAACDAAADDELGFGYATSSRAASDGRRKDVSSNSQGAKQDALGKIVALLNASDKSEHVLRERLAQVGYTSSEIEEGLERAKQYGFVDDRRFAEVLIRSRASQGRGLDGIQRELRQNGIEPDDLDQGYFAVVGDDQEQIERAVEFLNRKPPTAKNKRQAAFRKLVQRGYSTSIASTA